jgi:hypothetical protein
MWKWRLALLSFLSAVSFSSISGATPIQYQESAGGDLPSSAASKSFAFDVGSNTIQGNGAFADFDSFSFTIPVGDSITSETYSFSVTNPGGVVAFSTLFNSHGVQLVLGGAVQTPPIDLTGDFTTAVSNGSFACTGSCDSFTFNYTWTFVVSAPAAAVPEPASLAILVPASPCSASCVAGARQAGWHPFESDSSPRSAGLLFA